MEKRRRFTRIAQASQYLGIQVSQLRNRLKAFAGDPQHAFSARPDEV